MITIVTEFQKKLISLVEENEPLLVEICSELVRKPSETPPSDTRLIARSVIEFLQEVPGLEVTEHIKEDPVASVVARVRGAGPGPRLVFNGHLDTFPAGDESLWNHGPFSASVQDGRLYGRGAADMKGGIACSVLALILMASCRDRWGGEVVLTVAGDEEAMGPRGTAHLLDTVPDTGGDAMISGDAGSPQVLRFGEKGFLWVDFQAVGISSHGAHIHMGKNAVELLVEGLTEVRQSLENLSVSAPEAVTAAISKASSRSESVSGRGETEVLQSITMNLGMINGGTSPNLVPAAASASCDIRLPIGVGTSAVEQTISRVIEKYDGLSYEVFRRFEPSWSDINHEIFQLTSDYVYRVLGVDPAFNVRVGASDSRLYRDRGIPTVVCGLTPHNLGATDEYIEIAEMVKVAKIHLLTAFDYLSH